MNFWTSEQPTVSTVNWNIVIFRLPRILLDGGQGTAGQHIGCSNRLCAPHRREQGPLHWHHLHHQLLLLQHLKLLLLEEHHILLLLVMEFLLPLSDAVSLQDTHEAPREMVQGVSVTTIHGDSS